MAKPELKPIVSMKPVIRMHPPAKRAIVERFGNNEYRVVEETYDCPPTSVRVLQQNVARVPAEDEIRLWQETHLGLDRFADSGL